MTTIADCDLVFDILTRGPFPTGEPQDSLVEQHLAACHECRRLAEALRPAVGLMHEALDPGGHDLPSYSGPDGDQMVRTVMASISSSSEPEPTRSIERNWSRSRILPLLAIAMGVTMFLALTTSPGAKEPPVGGGAASQLVVRHQPDAKGRELLGTLALGGSCLPIQEASRSPLNSPLAYRCCTDCHSAAHGKSARESFPWSRFLRSCGACHDNLALGVESANRECEAAVSCRPATDKTPASWTSAFVGPGRSRWL